MTFQRLPTCHYPLLGRARLQKGLLAFAVRCITPLMHSLAHAPLSTPSSRGGGTAGTGAVAPLGKPPFPS